MHSNKVSLLLDPRTPSEGLESETSALVSFPDPQLHNLVLEPAVDKRSPVQS